MSSNDDFLSILNAIETQKEEVEKEISILLNVSSNPIENLNAIFEKGESVDISIEDIQRIREARSTAYITPDLIQRIFDNFNPALWLQRPLNISKQERIFKEAAALIDGYI